MSRRYGGRPWPRIVGPSGALLLSLSMFSAGLQATGLWRSGVAAAAVLLLIGVALLSWAFGYSVCLARHERSRWGRC